MIQEKAEWRPKTDERVIPLSEAPPLSLDRAVQEAQERAMGHCYSHRRT